MHERGQRARSAREARGARGARDLECFTCFSPFARWGGYDDILIYNREVRLEEKTEVSAKGKPLKNDLKKHDFPKKQNHQRPPGASAKNTEDLTISKTALDQKTVFSGSFRRPAANRQGGAFRPPG